MEAKVKGGEAPWSLSPSFPSLAKEGTSGRTCLTSQSQGHSSALVRACTDFWKYLRCKPNKKYSGLSETGGALELFSFYQN